MTSGILDFALGLLGTLAYPLFSIIFVLIDGIQYVFRSFAGIGKSGFDGQTINAGNTGAENDTGIVYFLMNNSLVKNMLGSIMLLAIVLIIIFTVMAFIKNIYSAKPKNWKEIVANAIKGLANFIFVPVCCLLGVWLGNILLNAINGATSYGGATSMDRKLFIACAYDANQFRNANAGSVEDAYERILASIEAYGLQDQIQVEPNRDMEYYATVVDQMYSLDRIPIHNHITVGVGITAHHGYYNLYQINYLVLIVGGIFILYVLCSLAFAMVRRLLLILVLFIISPGVAALYPLDEGKALGSWKSEFIKQVLSAYGAVAGLNIFFSLVPLIDKIQIYGGYSFQMDEFIQLFILVSGLLVVKELIALISGFVGGEDAYSKGASLMSSTRSAMKKYGGGAAKNVTGAFSTGATNFKKRGLWGGLWANTKAATNFAFNAFSGINMKKDIVDEWKAKSEAVSSAVEKEQMAETIKSKLDPISEKFKQASDALEKARENYENIKKRGKKAGQTDEDYEKEKWAAISAMGNPSRAAQNASKKMSSYLSSLPADILSWAEGRAAKKSGVSSSELHASVSAGKEAASFASKHTSAVLDARAMVDALDLAKKGDYSKAKGFGLDLSDLSDKLGKNIKDLIKLFEGGVKFDLSDKSVIKKHGQYSADDARIAATAFNQALEKQHAKEEKASEAGKAYVDHLLAQNGKFIDSKGLVVEYSDSQIQKLRDALKSGNPADVDSTEIAKLIRTETQNLQNATLKQISTFKDIAKALQDLNKKS